MFHQRNCRDSGLSPWKTNSPDFQDEQSENIFIQEHGKNLNQMALLKTKKIRSLKSIQPIPLLRPNCTIRHDNFPVARRKSKTSCRPDQPIGDSKDTYSYTAKLPLCLAKTVRNPSQEGHKYDTFSRERERSQKPILQELSIRHFIIEGSRSSNKELNFKVNLAIKKRQSSYVMKQKFAEIRKSNNLYPNRNKENALLRFIRYQ